jgi:hypothetical protein
VSTHPDWAIEVQERPTLGINRAQIGVLITRDLVMDLALLFQNGIRKGAHASHALGILSIQSHESQLKYQAKAAKMTQDEKPAELA